MMDLSEIAREIFVGALDDCRIEQAGIPHQDILRDWGHPLPIALCR